QSASVWRGTGQLQIAIWKVSWRPAVGYTHVLEQLISRDTDRKRDFGIGFLCPDVGYRALARGSSMPYARRVFATRPGRCLPDDDADLFRLLDFARERLTRCEAAGLLT